MGHVDGARDASRRAALCTDDTPRLARTPVASLPPGQVSRRSETVIRTGFPRPAAYVQAGKMATGANKSKGGLIMRQCSPSFDGKIVVACAPGSPRACAA